MSGAEKKSAEHHNPTELEKILNSKDKEKLLAFFATRPERAFFLGEIKKKIGGRKFMSDLTALLRQEILHSHSKRGRRYYRLNKRHPLYVQLRNWAKKFKHVSEDEFLKMASKLSGLRFAALSGFLTGETKLPCDLLLVGKLQQKQIKNFIIRAEKLVDNEINYAVMSLKEFQYRKDTFDRFMKDIFENDHAILVDRNRGQ